METILELLQARYLPEGNDDALTQEITQYYQLLSQHLSKADRKVVLRIMDNYGLRECQRTDKAFRTGFYLAWKLAMELNEYEKGRLSDDG